MRDIIMTEEDDDCLEQVKYAESLTEIEDPSFNDINECAEAFFDAARCYDTSGNRLKAAKYFTMAGEFYNTVDEDKAAECYGKAILRRLMADDLEGSRVLLELGQKSDKFDTFHFRLAERTFSQRITDEFDAMYDLDAELLEEEQTVEFDEVPAIADTLDDLQLDEIIEETITDDTNVTMKTLGSLDENEAVLGRIKGYKLQNIISEKKSDQLVETLLSSAKKKQGKKISSVSTAMSGGKVAELAPKHHLVTPEVQSEDEMPLEGELETIDLKIYSDQSSFEDLEDIDISLDQESAPLPTLESVDSSLKDVIQSKRPSVIATKDISYDDLDLSTPRVKETSTESIGRIDEYSDSIEIEGSKLEDISVKESSFPTETTSDLSDPELIPTTIKDSGVTHSLEELSDLETSDMTQPLPDGSIDEIGEISRLKDDLTIESSTIEDIKIPIFPMAPPNLKNPKELSPELSTELVKQKTEVTPLAELQEPEISLERLDYTGFLVEDEIKSVSEVENVYAEDLENIEIQDEIPIDFSVTGVRASPGFKLVSRTVNKESNAVIFTWKKDKLASSKKARIEYKLQKRIQRTFVGVTKSQVYVATSYYTLDKVSETNIAKASLQFINSFNEPLTYLLIEDTIPLEFKITKLKPEDIPIQRYYTKEGLLFRYLFRDFEVNKEFNIEYEATPRPLTIWMDKEISFENKPDASILITKIAEPKIDAFKHYYTVFYEIIGKNIPDLTIDLYDEVPDQRELVELVGAYPTWMRPAIEVDIQERKRKYLWKNIELTGNKTRRFVYLMKGDRPLIFKEPVIIIRKNDDKAKVKSHSSSEEQIDERLDLRRKMGFAVMKKE